MLTINCSCTRLEGLPTATASLFSQNPSIFIPNSVVENLYPITPIDISEIFSQAERHGVLVAL